MDALEAIYTRHSISKMLPDPVPVELIEQLLSAAVQAPNHYHVYPWRFVVISGAARERLGDAFALSMAKRQPDMPPAGLDKERQKPLRAPVLIAVAADLPDDPRVLAVENVCAAAAAIENLLLAAHAIGLGGMWRTGAPAYDPDVKTFLGFSPDQPLIGFVYIGYPAVEPLAPPRPGFQEHVKWMD